MRQLWYANETTLMPSAVGGTLLTVVAAIRRASRRSVVAALASYLLVKRPCIQVSTFVCLVYHTNW